VISLWLGTCKCGLWWHKAHTHTRLFCTWPISFFISLPYCDAAMGWWCYATMFHKSNEPLYKVLGFRCFVIATEKTRTPRLSWPAPLPVTLMREEPYLSSSALHLQQSRLGLWFKSWFESRLCLSWGVRMWANSFTSPSLGFIISTMEIMTVLPHRTIVGVSSSHIYIVLNNSVPGIR
jgi:hypothetical protein